MARMIDPANALGHTHIATLRLERAANRSHALQMLRSAYPWHIRTGTPPSADPPYYAQAAELDHYEATGACPERAAILRAAREAGSIADAGQRWPDGLTRGDTQ